MEKMITRTTLSAGLLALLIAATAHADFTPIPLPNAAYQSSTTLLGIVAADFDVLSSLSDGGTETVTFDTGLVALTVPGSWSSWGSPPNTESSTPRVLWTNGFTWLQMTLRRLP